MEIRDEYNIVAISLHRVFTLGRNHDGAVMSVLFLPHAMGVIPVGAILPDFEAIGEGFAGLDAGEAVKAGNAIHLTGQYQPMPVDGSIFVQFVGDVNDGFLPFRKAQGRAGNGAVDGDFFSRVTSDVHGFAGNSQAVFFRQSREACTDQDRKYCNMTKMFHEISFRMFQERAKPQSCGMKEI